jgi:transcriptional regulator with XRE-family HTH domain
MRFGEKLRTHRRKANISQQALATVLGCSRTTIVNYEIGASYPQDREVYAKLSDHFEVDKNYFLTENEPIFTLIPNIDDYTGSEQADMILQHAKALFAGGKLSEADQLAFVHELQGLYLESKQMANKTTK